MMSWVSVMNRSLDTLMDMDKMIVAAFLKAKAAIHGR
jgi:hypothetical protein